MQVYDRGKQGAVFGCTKVRGYPPGHLTRPRPLRLPLRRGARYREDVERPVLGVTARQERKIRAASEAIDVAAWTPIPHWLSTSEVSGADVVETTYTCLAGTKHATQVRLVVRRSVRHSGGRGLRRSVATKLPDD